MIFCHGCGKEIHESAASCPHCGASQSKTSSGFGKKQSTAFLLSFFLGGLGAHRFYLGSVGLGFLYLFTFGLLGIGALIDMFNLAFMRSEVFAAKYNNGGLGQPIGIWAKVMALIIPAIFVMAIISTVGKSSYQGYKQGKTGEVSELASAMNQPIPSQTPVAAQIAVSAVGTIHTGTDGQGSLDSDTKSYSFDMGSDVGNKIFATCKWGDACEIQAVVDDKDNILSILSIKKGK